MLEIALKLNPKHMDARMYMKLA